MADLNSVFLFARCGTKRDLAAIRRALQSATQELEESLRPDVPTLLGAYAATRLVAYATCLDGLSNEENLAPLVRAVGGVDAFDLYWRAPEGLACRYGAVMPWRREATCVRAHLDVAPDTLKALASLLVKQGPAADTWRLVTPLVAGPRTTSDPLRAVDVVLGPDDPGRWVPEPWRELVDRLVEARSAGRAVSAALLGEQGLVGRIDVRGGRVSVSFEVESTLLELVERSEDLREHRAGGRWKKRTTSHPTVDDGSRRTPADLNVQALAMWRGTGRLVDELGAVGRFREATSGASEAEDERTARAARRSLSALLAWRPDARSPSDPEPQLLGVHNLVFLYARYENASARERGIDGLKRATEASFDAFHFCTAPEVGGIVADVRDKGHFLRYRACLSRPCDEDQVEWLRKSVEEAQARDLYWEDARSRVCRVEGACLAPIECVSADFHWVNMQRVDRAVQVAHLEALGPLLGEPFTATGKRLVTPLVYEIPRGTLQRRRIPLGVTGSSLPAGFSSSWHPFVDRLRELLRAEIPVRLTLHHRGGGALAMIMGEAGSEPRLEVTWTELHHDLLVRRTLVSQEFDEVGTWVDESDDVFLLHWRRAIAGDASTERSLATDLASGTHGPVDEAAAAMWYRRSIARETQEASLALAIRNFKSLLARRPDLREPGDPE